MATHGTLAAVAAKLAEERRFAEDLDSVERALRRLRARAHADGGAWGQRALRTFGLPGAVEDRVRWMGHYHTRFTDLPRSLGLELLRPWDRPPVSTSSARAWVQLGLASIALRGRELDRARAHLHQAELAAVGPARAEVLLVRAYVDRTDASLDEAEQIVATLPNDDDTACLVARLVDHRGHTLNVARRDPAAAEALYAALPEAGPPFALVRRHNGLGWSVLSQGRRDEAVHHAAISLRHAGDGGSLRLRAMALNLRAHALGTDTAEGAAALDRARAIAARLEDEALRVRFGA